MSFSSEDSLYSSMMLPTDYVTPTVNVTELINKGNKSGPAWDSALAGKMLLSADQTSKVICALSQQVDK